VPDAALDDVFADDITFPATDGFFLGGTLYLPRSGRRSHAVLINSAVAVPRKIYRGFASYLAGRGCAVLTYDYRGIGGSRPAKPGESLSGFEATMSDWAARDVVAAVAWMRERYAALPLAYVGHSFGGQALGLIPNSTDVSRALLVAAQAASWRLMARPEAYRIYALMKFIGAPLTRVLGYAPGRPDLHHITPMEVGAKKIGHFGFFRPEHRDTLWRGAAEWLQREPD
jgi:predicted alpha/beta hydrolase